ncbi:MAG: iron-sulfur cluster assembly scaffold protein [Rhodocyclaceae bacterium]|nr:iron-sulfur cluster assembly scaffold protein [Rhodocyclaceae bacterium]
MSEEIYQQAIKELAQAAHGAGRLAQPTASVRLDNALCGDRVTLDLRSEGDTIAELAHETRGCLLCRAAASLLAREAPGKSADELARAHAALTALLQGDPAEPLPWPALSIFAPVRAYKSRHGCVLLPFRALREAIGSSDRTD